MKNSEYIGKALEYIGKSWNDADISLASVADSAGFSVAYFDRMFAEATGKAVMAYVRTFRLIKSAAMLRNSGKSILDIALELGYACPENYTRAFRAVYGVPPAEYRERHETIPLRWKDISTGTVIARFESAYPELERIPFDELIDTLCITDPVKYAPYISIADEIDCAAYRLDGENAFMSVEEYDAETVSMTLYCRDADAERYLGMAKAFPKAVIEKLFDTDFEFSENDFGMAGFTRQEYFNFAYTSDEIEITHMRDYGVRELAEGDREQVEILSRCKKPTDNSILYRVFDQKFTYGNAGGTRFYGLFHKKGELAACALPSMERGRGMTISDIGGIFVKEGHTEHARYLWACVIDAMLKEGALPTNTGAGEDGIIGAAASGEMGYTLTSKKLVYIR